MRRYFKQIRVLNIILLVLLALEIATYIILASLRVFKKDEYTYLEILLGVLTPVLIFAWAVVLNKYIGLKSTFKDLVLENEYYLGRQSTFYNFPIFEKQANRMIKRRKKETFYILSFTACSQEVSANYTRNNIVVQYNGIIADMLVNYFSEHKKYKHLDSTYAYYRDCFMLLVCGNEQRINTILKDLENNLYEVARENQIRLFVQPFFGVSKYNVNEDIGVNISNAIMARLQSEKSFELATFFDENKKSVLEKSEIEEIINALKNKEFVVYYQPKYHLESKRFISAEALVRWNSPIHGLIPPSKFIAKAEAAGLIHDIDMYVFKKVCEDLNTAKRKGRRIIPVSINFSLYEFYSPNFIEDIVNAIDKNGIPHNLIEIEITESTSQSNPFLSISIMKKLKEKGLRVLMDDFGVGYSNFINLKKMPIDCLKIDKSFIDEIVTDNKTREIVKFLISLGKNSGLEIIAEGVDNKQQVEILKKAKLDTIQGYYYSKPLNAKEYEAFLFENPFEKKENE